MSNYSEINKKKMEYFQNLFPWETVFQMFHVTPERGFREFSFRCWNERKDSEYVIRGLCFESADTLRMYLLENHLRTILKLDVGPVLSNIPKRGTGKPSFVSNSLKFDFDAQDLKERTCACKDHDKDKMVCGDCFHILATKASRLKSVLQKDYGIDRVLTVFSGNRGIHMWVPNSEFMYNESFKTSLAQRMARVYNVHLDAKVTSGHSHLLKCPFSPHPWTGKLCMPTPMELMLRPDFLENAFTVQTIRKEDMDNAVLFTKSCWGLE